MHWTITLKGYNGPLPNHSLIASLVILETAVLVSRPIFCGLGLGLDTAGLGLGLGFGTAGLGLGLEVSVLN